MSSPMPLLSMCMATFNRAELIGETLTSIVEQMTSEVELIVVDGGSTDATREQVAPFLDGVARVRYLRQDENSGVDADFDLAVMEASGRFVWLFPDDDLLMPGALARVLAAIEEDVDLVVANAQVANSDFSRVLDARMLDVEQDVRFDGDADALFAQLAQTLTFIGCTIIRRELWLKRDRKSYYGSLFVHVGVIFQDPPLNRALLLADPLVRIRYGNAMWTPRSFEVWMRKWPQLVWSFTALTERSRRSVSRPEPWRQVSKLFHYRAKNVFTPDEYVRWFGAERSFRRRAPAWLISRLPVALTNLLALLLLSIRRGDNLTPIYDLALSQPNERLRAWLLRRYDLR